jgi:pimeloyl-ACP methyl ester carboxylesterase
MPDPDRPSPASWPEPRTTTSTDGVDLAVYDLGGAGADVLMVHATGFCAGVWAPLAAHLPELRRAALDVRGHGRSTSPAVVDWDDAANDVLAAVDELGLHRPFGVGHSMGGALLAIAELQRPGTFSGLWLYEPIIFPASLVEAGGDRSNPLAEGARRRRARFDSAQHAVENFASKPPLKALHPDALEAYVEHGFEAQPDGSVVLRCAPEVEAANYDAGGRHRTFERLGELQCPTTVLHGDASVPGPASMAPVLVDAMPAATLEEHPALGHFGPLEDPAAMAASIRLAVTGGS